MTTSLKTCFKCGAEKPRSEFYRHKQMADGLLGKCKVCTKMDVRNRRFNPETREKVLKYDRARGNRQPPEYFTRKKRSEPEKDVAKNAVNNAVRDGKLEKPDRCSHCYKGDTRIVGHHPDYSKPLQVVWLCDACHRQLHALLDTVERSTAKAEP